ncbi:TetR/AcrR family transcriptional regulator [Ahrensia marina]|uniref:TetR family transcriptional regulator n=1 Tax=Ahrensia marina TaxID=1514904 RepID=A0A0N0E6C9_9HYPH|nr:TetR/AcrR family transcriptional regulator [Ahrensia marina]KPA99874.1 TetR family transcriptional regulator [Ahrensia marina]
MANGAETRIRRSREKILAAAENIFLRHGFLGTNMDNVADHANVSKQTVYAHFGSKEALFIDVVEAMTGGATHKLGEDREEIFDERAAAVYFLEAAIDQLTVVMTPRLMRLRRLVIGEVERFPELGKSLYLNGPKRSIERLARACEHYTSIGELDTPDPHKAATQFNWMLMGAPTNAAMLLGDEGIPDQKQLREHADEAVRIFLRAYAP